MGASVRQPVSRKSQLRELVVPDAMPSRPMALWEWSHKHLARVSTASASRGHMLDRMWPFHRNTFHHIRSSSPYWLMRDGRGDARLELQEQIECDVAVIGAGITGALIADALVATGQRIVILDSRDVALGSTAATTALLQYEIDTPLTELVTQLGADAAARAYLACASSFNLLEQRFPELLQVSNYRRVPSLYLAEDSRSVSALQAELAARRALGLQCTWLEPGELVERHGCRRPGAILSALG